MSCGAVRDRSTPEHRCECRAADGHTTAHDCRCGRSWWNSGPEAPPRPAGPHGTVHVEGKGWVPRGKAHAYEALGFTVEWTAKTAAPGTDLRILHYKDDD